MKPHFSFTLSVAIAIACFFLFSFCNRDDKANKDSTNASNSVKKTKYRRLPTEYEPTNRTTASKKHRKRERDSVKQDATTNSNTGIDFNSTRNRRNTTTANNGTRPGSTGIHPTPFDPLNPAKTNTPAPTFSSGSHSESTT